MTLAVGTRLGSFEIHSPLGEGGMGEVYRARDIRLARDVAIKVLPAAVATDPERLLRFAREAQVLASLNHPHIAQIYGLEEADGVRALVMELVEGPTLAELIAQKSAAPGDHVLPGTASGRQPQQAAEARPRGIPIADALAVAKQIAEALEAAHDRGIIHRDLKPANIKVRPDGTVKVLDFGLAKALDNPTAAGSASAAMSPTLSIHATEAGIILGTAAYMSPEQAAGKAADRRTDLWAFGVVLLEMLTGRPVFTGETVSHVLAEVLKSDPDWTALPAETPVPIRRLLRRCLEKNRNRRLDSAADARLEVEEALAAPAAETVPTRAISRQSLVLMLAAALAVGALMAALGTWAVMRGAPQTPVSPTRFAITPRPSQPLRINPFENTVALSPDGLHLVYSTREMDMRARLSGTSGTLMVRPLDRLDARPLVPFGRNPFFPPDGAWIGFFDDNDFFLKKIPLSGGSAIGICRFVGGPRGASWSKDNTIVFATGDPSTGLWSVPAGGGEPTVLTTPDASRHEGDHLFPSVLPAGRGILFTIAEPGQLDTAQVAVLDSQTAQHRTLIRGGSHAMYVETGHLVYAAAGTLRAVPFDLATLQVLGEPVPVVDDVMMTTTGAAFYALSQTGILVYVPGGAPAQPPRSLVWIDREGREQAIKAPLRAYAAARLSPDGTRVALDIRDQENDIWIWDLARETLRKLTHGPSLDQHPVWTRDGRRVIFTSNRAGPYNLYVADGTGTVARLTTSDKAQWPTAITADGAWVVGHEFGAGTSFDLFLLPLANGAGQPARQGTAREAGRSRGDPLVQEALAQSSAELSPDGRYLAYQSNESGRFEIYVRPFPDVNRGKWQVSTDGGIRPVWAGHGRELFYIDGSRALLALPVEISGAAFGWGNPVRILGDTLEDAAVNLRDYDVTLDGRRFLMLRDQAASGPKTEPAHIIVVLNWLEELKAKLPAGR